MEEPATNTLLIVDVLRNMRLLDEILMERVLLVVLKKTYFDFQVCSYVNGSPANFRQNIFYCKNQIAKNLSLSNFSVVKTVIWDVDGWRSASIFEEILDLILIYKLNYLIHFAEFMIALVDRILAWNTLLNYLISDVAISRLWPWWQKLRGLFYRKNFAKTKNIKHNMNFQHWSDPMD